MECLNFRRFGQFGSRDRCRRPGTMIATSCYVRIYFVVLLLLSHTFRVYGSSANLQIYIESDEVCSNSTAQIDLDEMDVVNMGGSLNVAMKKRLFDSMEKVEECPQQGKAGQCTDIKIEECNETICNILIPLENYKDKVNPQAFTSLTLRQNETRQNYLVWPRQLNFKTSGCIEDKTYEYKYNLSHNETYWGIITFLFLGFYALIGVVRRQKEETFSIFFQKVCRESRDHIVAPFAALWNFLKKRLYVLKSKSKTSVLEKKKKKQKLTKVMSTKQRASVILNEEKRAENLERVTQLIENSKSDSEVRFASGTADALADSPDNNSSENLFNNLETRKTGMHLNCTVEEAEMKRRGVIPAIELNRDYIQLTGICVSGLNMPEYFVFGWNFSMPFTFDFNLPSFTFNVDSAVFMSLFLFLINCFYGAYVFNYYWHDRKYTARAKQKELLRQVKTSKIGEGKLYHWLDINTNIRAAATFVIETICLMMLKRSFNVIRCVGSSQCWACGVRLKSDSELIANADWFAYINAWLAFLFFFFGVLYMSHKFIADNCPYIWLHYNELGEEMKFRKALDKEIREKQQQNDMLASKLLKQEVHTATPNTCFHRLKLLLYDSVYSDDQIALYGRELRQDESPYGNIYKDLHIERRYFKWWKLLMKMFLVGVMTVVPEDTDRYSPRTFLTFSIFLVLTLMARFLDPYMSEEANRLNVEANSSTLTILFLNLYANDVLIPSGVRVGCAVVMNFVGLYTLFTMFKGCYDSIVLYYRYTFTDIVFYPDTTEKTGLQNIQQLHKLSSQNMGFIPIEIQKRIWCVGWDNIIKNVAAPKATATKRKRKRICCCVCGSSSKVTDLVGAQTIKHSLDIKNGKILSNFEDTKGIARLKGTKWLQEKVDRNDNNLDLIQATKDMTSKWGHKSEEKELKEVANWGMRTPSFKRKNDEHNIDMTIGGMGDAYLDTAALNDFYSQFPQKDSKKSQQTIGSTKYTVKEPGIVFEKIISVIRKSHAYKKQRETALDVFKMIASQQKRNDDIGSDRYRAQDALQELNRGMHRNILSLRDVRIDGYDKKTSGFFRIHISDIRGTKRYMYFPPKFTIGQLCDLLRAAMDRKGIKNVTVLVYVLEAPKNNNDNRIPVYYPSQTKLNKFDSFLAVNGLTFEYLDAQLDGEDTLVGNLSKLRTTGLINDILNLLNDLKLTPKLKGTAERDSLVFVDSTKRGKWEELRRLVQKVIDEEYVHEDKKITLKEMCQTLMLNRDIHDLLQDVPGMKWFLKPRHFLKSFSKIPEIAGNKVKSYTETEKYGVCDFCKNSVKSTNEGEKIQCASCRKMVQVKLMEKTYSYKYISIMDGRKFLDSREFVELFWKYSVALHIKEQAENMASVKPKAPIDETFWSEVLNCFDPSDKRKIKQSWDASKVDDVFAYLYDIKP
eukprot:g15133.t1